jgi:predicted  nucleic acid-binding Zn-ribbon protein
MLNKEIEFQSLEVELCNKKIAEAEHRIADRRADLDNARRQLEEKRGDLEVKKSELDEIISETRIEEDRLQIQVRELESLIDPGLLNSFLRIRKNARNGLGIVYVHRDACGGCFNKIPPQRQMDIRMHKKIIVCEYCGRILIDPELADVPVEKPVEEDKKPARKRATARKSASSKKTTDANDME